MITEASTEAPSRKDWLHLTATSCHSARNSLLSADSGRVTAGDTGAVPRTQAASSRPGTQWRGGGICSYMGATSYLLMPSYSSGISHKLEEFPSYSWEFPHIVNLAFQDRCQAQEERWHTHTHTNIMKTHVLCGSISRGSGGGGSWPWRQCLAWLHCPRCLQGAVTAWLVLFLGTEKSPTSEI